MGMSNLILDNVEEFWSQELIKTIGECECVDRMGRSNENT